MTRQNPRRPASSRTPVNRPRRVAGQGSAPPESPAEAAETPAVPSPEPPEEPPAPSTNSGEPLAEPEPVEPEEPEHSEDPDRDGRDRLVEAPEVLADRRGLGPLFESRRATVVLATLAVLFALAAGGMFVVDATRDDPPTATKMPVSITEDDATTAVAEAAKAAETIVATSYQDYDDQVDEATGLMTDAFAKEYRQTAEDIKPDFVASKTEIEVRVVAQGIMSSTRSEVKALLFLNQYVSKDGGDTTYTPYRALVTVVHTDSGWLVAGLDTK